MDDFSTPGERNYFGLLPSQFNFIEPGKRPMSSMSPCVVVDEQTGDALMAVGASGGTKIIFVTAYVSARCKIVLAVKFLKSIFENIILVFLRKFHWNYSLEKIYIMNKYIKKQSFTSFLAKVDMHGQLFPLIFSFGKISINIIQQVPYPSARHYNCSVVLEDMIPVELFVH